MRQIPGQVNYFATRNGEIFSKKKGYFQKMSLFSRGRQGHLGVNLCQNGKYTLHSVHRLIALTFIGGPPTARHVVMHLDDNPINNAIDNLTYGLPAENSAQMTARCRQATGSRVGGAKLTDSLVKAIRENISSGVVQRDLAQGISHGNYHKADKGSGSAVS